MCSSICEWEAHIISGEDIGMEPLFDIETGERFNLYRVDNIGGEILLYSFRTETAAKLALDNHSKRRSGKFIYRKVDKTK